MVSKGFEGFLRGIERDSEFEISDENNDGVLEEG
jgi:hypothetical protein